MLSVSKNGIVTVNRGDNFSLNVQVNIGTVFEPIIYSLEENDKLYFGLCECNQPFEHALIRKVFTSENQDEEGNIDINFIPEDTEFLVPDNYYYSVKLFRAYDNVVDTIIPRTKFVIIE